MTNEIKHYFDILEQIVADEHLLSAQSDRQMQRISRLNKIITYMMVASVLFLILAMFLWVVATVGRELQTLKGIADWLFTVFFLIYCILLMLVFFRKSSGLTTMRIFSATDSKYLSALKSLPYETLALGCLELEHGRDWFNRGFASLIGVIEKVGLIPSILSLIVVFAIPNKLPEWAWPLISLAFLLYLTVAVLHERIIRFDRLLALTRLAIELKEK